MGRWTIDVEATAEVLAMAQFKPQLVTAIKGNGHKPAISETHEERPKFDQMKFDEQRRFWRDGLQAPEMKWTLTFNKDGTGEHAHMSKDKQPGSARFRWRQEGTQVQVEYPDEPKFKRTQLEIVSTNRLNYPMQPVGGWFVLRKN